MKNHIVYAAAVSALLCVGQAQAGPGMDLDTDGLGILEIEPIEMDMVRTRDGTLIMREIYTHQDGSLVKRMTIRKPSATASDPAKTVELTPSQRRLIWNSVVVPNTARSGDEVPAETAAMPVREHIEATPGLKSYNVGTRIPVPSSLQLLPEEVTLAVPNVQDHLYAVVGERVLVVEPVTKTVVAEVVR